MHIFEVVFAQFVGDHEVELTLAVGLDVVVDEDIEKEGMIEEESGYIQLHLAISVFFRKQLSQIFQLELIDGEVEDEDIGRDIH